MAGAGKSTFARALGAATGLPVIHLDVHYWQPGWTPPSDEQWAQVQRTLLAGDAWIADGNYYETLDLQLARADAVVILETAWWLCAGRAVLRGLRPRPAHVELPAGCADTVRQRLLDEWGIAWRTWRRRRTEPGRACALVAASGSPAAVHVLRSKRDAEELLGGLPHG